jgi:hypothetical protein
MPASLFPESAGFVAVFDAAPFSEFSDCRPLDAARASSADFPLSLPAILLSALATADRSSPLRAVCPGEAFCAVCDSAGAADLPELLADEFDGAPAD